MKRLLSIILLALSCVAVKAEAPKSEPVVGEGKWVRTFVFEWVDPRVRKNMSETRTEWISLTVVDGVNRYSRSYYQNSHPVRESGEWSLNGDSLELWDIPTDKDNPSFGEKPSKPQVLKVKAVSPGVVSMGVPVKVHVSDDENFSPVYEMQVKEWGEFKLQTDKK